ncbi:MAG: GFA family protein [Hyphomonadaceae bacterium]
MMQMPARPGSDARKAKTNASKPKKERGLVALGRCLCGKVTIEIGVPARWAWHDHSAASRRAHGAAYATYVGSWRSRFRVVEGEKHIARYMEPETKNTRSFCKSCGAPVAYERARAPQMVNVPRALFATRTGREPLYHLAIEEMQDWAYTGQRLVPLKGFPGVVWESGKRKRPAGDDLLA